MNANETRANETRNIIAALRAEQVIYAAQVINQAAGYNWPTTTGSPAVLRRLLSTYAARPVVSAAVIKASQS